MRNNVLFCDCMKYMKTCDDNKYDLCICDPPYGIGKTWSKSKSNQFYRHKSTYNNNQSEKPTAFYISELQRISKNQIIWGWNYFCHLLPETNHVIIWDKDRNADVTYMSEAELAWHSFSQPVKIYKKPWNGALKGPETGIKKIHPFQKPIGLYRWLLKNYAKPGQIIFDSHVGSGSIRIACHDMGFDFTGTEIDKDYFEAQEKRYQDYIKQFDLFGNKEIQELIYEK